MRLVTWNVNGIRACIKNGFHDFVRDVAPDILCLQEIKAHPDQVDLALSDYHHFWNPAVKPGYSGTAIFSRKEPLSVRNGMGTEALDQEGRVTTAEFDDFFVVSVYTPNSQRELTRHDYRVNTWEPAFLSYVKSLEQKKPVIFCGDLNVAHTEIDLANPKSNMRNAGFTPEERARFSEVIASGFVDVFREFETGSGHYTWWTYRNGARARNIGWRLDYFCASTLLRPRLKSAKILCDVMGSDHCPVMMEIH